MKLDISYRGYLSSCNYDCSYCPFAKTVDNRDTLKQDAQALGRFTRWLEQQSEYRLDVLFTPWGEGLVRKHYRQALIEISHFDHIHRVAIQTNLSTSLNWLKKANNDTLKLWTTYHPSQMSVEKFVHQSRTLSALGIQHSVGMVGAHSLLEAARELRRILPADTYLWINAYDDDPDYYSDAQAAQWQVIDPYFPLNRNRYKTLGQTCSAGETALFIDGKGDVSPCHFISTHLGNIYRDKLSDILTPMHCSNTDCNCYIGYRHLKKLKLKKIYGDNLIARIPINSRPE
ncbi:STM4011 family radical SAM protein [Gynuella sunshinyii]|uniref:Putative Fe-S oxidoreductase n=1 Tax=Gynuella sunshinyii YC6258 TaxID=1445510 RepID=A0A0C5VKY7_9GAMM|nr:STM4011 family radical SAM protein [Gynuella sunshinyii]AJQ95347.1 putative Fe-S oxidoreductase [Gynuella sunshinyii YC6258]